MSKRKWVEIRIKYDDGTEDVWTPESLEKVRHIRFDEIEFTRL